MLVVKSADPDYFIPHVDLTQVTEYRREAAGLASSASSRPVAARGGIPLNRVGILQACIEQPEQARDLLDAAIVLTPTGRTDTVDPDELNAAERATGQIGHDNRT